MMQNSKRVSVPAESPACEPSILDRTASRGPSETPLATLARLELLELLVMSHHCFLALFD